MSKLPDLHVNLADPEDIRRQLPKAMEFLGELHHRLSEAQEDFDNWMQLVRRLEMLAGEEDALDRPLPLRLGSPDDAVSLQDMAVAIVEQEGQPLRPRDVVAHLERMGYPVTSVGSVNSALHAAAKSGRLNRPEKGLYAPVHLDNWMPYDALEAHNRGSSA